MTRSLFPVCAALGLAVLAGGAPSAAPAAAAAQDGKACFYARNLSSWREADDRTVYLRVGVRDIYQLQLLGPCPDLKWTEAVGIETRGGSDFICSGLDISLIVPSRVTHTVPQRCMATNLNKLSAAEAAALPKKLRP